MDLPFVGGGLRAIEMIRRPPVGEDPNSLVGKSRMYNMAQIRVLISDTAAENPGGAGVRLANVAPYYNGTGTTYGDTDTAFAEANKAVDGDYLIDNHTPHICESGEAAVDVVEGGTNECWSLIDGFLLVQSKQADGSYDDVTEEWLDLGIARENGDAILKFQAVKDENKPPDGVPDFNNLPFDLGIPWRSVHLGLYDSREGEVRDDNGDTSSNCAIGGIMNNVELDVGNLKRWFAGTTGTNTDWAPQNGYVFYFSDRRGMLPNGSGVKGEYGFEDTVNPPESDGSPDGLFHASEDVNQNGVLDTYGGANLGDGFAVSNNDPTIIIDCKNKGRLNRVSGARRGLKLINGALNGAVTNVPTKPDGTGGFTVASENIVYVMGNYNADDAGFGDPHAAASVIADTASFLSKDWEDWRSWRWPIDPDSRPATDSYYRLAVAAGKNINFPSPAWAPNDDPGLDGGTHNFLRYLEDWSGTFNYRGSLVSLYYSEYATGIYKCCQRVYGPPTRAYAFDTDFLELDKLPPGTPRFRDVVNLGMRQILTPD